MTRGSLDRCLRTPAARLAIGLSVFLCGLIGAMRAAESADATLVSVEASRSNAKFFESEVRPLLIRRCYECHSETESEGGLRLDVATTITQGGDSGVAVIPGDADASLLMAAIRYDGLEMPPDEPLTESETEILRRWIDQGAYWPESFGHAGDDSDSDSDAQDYWAAEPVRTVPPIGMVPTGDFPAAAGMIDRYIDDALATAGLSRAPRSDRRTLLRRLFYDVTGMPPGQSDIDDFLADDSPDAYARTVDRLLADPRHGERIGRFWLDLVRFSESDGYRQDAFRASAHRYRDWVVNAWNTAMPYDEFVTMQIAGDEVDPNSEEALTAAGFLRQGIYEYNQRDAEGQWEVIVDELTDVTADVFLATGLACAKCHDHKFDPIPRSDYFHFRSVFEPLIFRDITNPKISDTADARNRTKIESLVAELATIDSEALEKAGRAAAELFPDEVLAMYDKPADQRNSYESQIAHLVHLQVLDRQARDSEIEKTIGKEATARRREIIAELKQLGYSPRPSRPVMTVADASGDIRPTRLPGRHSGRSFAPEVPEIYGGMPLDVAPPPSDPTSTGRRLALARWMTSPENPVTARVIANRIWQHYFGRGIVASPNDFGALGTPPTHPELLDYLADRLQRTGWDLKRLQREILLSETYRQSAHHPRRADGQRIDAINRLLWRRSVRRLDAEQYRDTLLAVMDQVNHQIGGPSPSGAPPRRTIYLQRKRNTGDEMLQLMDAPTGIVGTARRDVTITATQSLMMINNDRLIHVSEKYADRVQADLRRDGIHRDSGDWAEQFVRHAALILTCQPMSDDDVELLSPLVQAGDDGCRDVCHVLLNANAFLFVE
ncbi:PSD1 and planctomycete cytochrome C domain-containing protein [Crateriforma conspicua]|uniref:PSD1 and planctomycete cytochrome C domain-containing protein n=1 Tax=Crateriforma conspicua TaxID=2527996 RepID=UPI001188DD6E|nr:PSD1 and planctomycete cytochrome C domain-containing protein [Crateriforma conspicua]QDV63452.1 Planctomycete cytochrome C [Crateriforma conspicua]